MYEQHFGLEQRPFRASATDADVFVGPQAATTMSGLIKALATSDAIVTVCGPVGCGKTTLVRRALDGLNDNCKVIPVARLRLNAADILDMLLEELGDKNPPSGAIQKFVAFRRLLKELEGKDTRVFIVVEDGVRLDVDTLAELEALTAADAGHSQGACIVLMGDDRLQEVLRDPQLARIRQRIRQTHLIAPLSAAELRGYLNHCFRRAGGDFDKLFEADAAVLLHRLSGGIPRITNNLVDSAMSAAAGQNLERVPSSLLARIAENEFGLSGEGFSSAPEQMIQDTMPNLKILAPKVAAAAVDPAPRPAPEIVAEPQPVTKPASVELAAWDRDPTLAQLRPDLAALEQAMATAKSDETLPPAAGIDADKTAAESEPQKIPEITLDHAISQRIEDNLIDEPGEISPEGSENVPANRPEENTRTDDLQQKNDAKDKAEIDKIAAELGNAKSIEDVDGKAAETLFGEEFSLIAAQVVAKVQAAKSANDALEPAVSVAPAETPIPRATNNGDETDLSPTQQRLKTVRDLNAVKTPQPVPAAVIEKPASAPANVPTEVPHSIEDQINTSMTATLRALKVRHASEDDASDDEEESKDGFFNRFKRS